MITFDGKNKIIFKHEKVDFNKLSSGIFAAINASCFGLETRISVSGNLSYLNR